MKAILDAGYLKSIVSDLTAIPEYWNKFLLDHPNHPVATSRLRNSTLGFTLYSPLITLVFFLLCIATAKV